MKLYIVETGSYEESYIIYISENLNMAEKICDQVALKNKETPYRRWTTISQIETDVEYWGIDIDDDEKPQILRIRSESNMKG